MTYSFRTNGNFIDFVHTDNTSLQVENVLRSLHISSRSIGWSFPEDETRISFNFDYLIIADFLISEIDFDGVVMDSQDDFETGMIAMFPSLAGGEASSSPLVYSAYLTQTGTDNPIATVLQNTLGGAVTWTRNQEGQYFATTAGLFTVGRTFMSPFGASGFSILQYSSLGYTQGYLFDANQFTFETYSDTIYTYVELSTILGASGTVLIEIKVYP